MLLVATEDELSEAVAAKIANEIFGDAQVRFVRQGGFGYLRKNMRKWSEVSRNFPVLVLTDLDRAVCAPRLVANWSEGRELPSNLKLRVAVRETESWLFADREGFAEFLSIARASVTAAPESIDDPKRYLLGLAKRAPRDVRDDLLPSRGSIATQGFGYNQRLGQFVREKWSPLRAAEASSSLRKAIDRLSDLVDVV